MWLSLVLAHNLLQSLIACHICWAVEKTFSSLIACNARLAEAIAGMQINSINFRLNDLLEQLASICQRPFERLWNFRFLTTGSHPEPRDFAFAVVSLLFKSPIAATVSVTDGKLLRKRDFFRIREDWAWHLTRRDVKRQFGLAESHWKPVRVEPKTSCLRKKGFTAKTCLRDSCGNQCESSLA